MNDTVKTPKRVVFLDVLRVFAAAAVVLMHTVTGVLNGGFDMTGYERRRSAFLAIVDATTWCVPVFLMISGFLLLGRKRKITWKETIFLYCRRVFLALVLFGIPYSLLEQIGGERAFRIDMLPKAVWATATGNSWAHMWYLYLILLLYAISPILKWILEKVPRWAVYALLILLVTFAGALPFAEALLGSGYAFLIPQESIYLFYYLMGYVFAVRERRPFAAEGYLCLGLFGLIEILEMGSRFIPGYELNLAYAYLPTVLASVLLFNGCVALWKEGEDAKTSEDPDKQKDQDRMTKVFKSMAELSFGVYLIHPVFLNFFYKFLKISIMDFRFFVGLPLFFAIAYLGASLVTWALKKIPVLRKYVL